MNLSRYNIDVNSERTIYEFTTTNNIEKAVIYDTTNDENVYNLGFGNISYDSIIENYIVNDQVVDNGSDIRQILATVAYTAYEFTKEYPHITIFFRGSDGRRTNVYKRAINIHFEELSKTFNIFGALFNTSGNITDEPFDYKKDFDGFLFKRK